MKNLYQLNGLYSMETGNAETPVGNGLLVIKRVNKTEAPNNGVVLEYGNSTSWVGQLYIGDNATQGIYYNGWSNGTRGSWRRLADTPVNLYDNSSGTNGNVPLSQSAANFTYLEVFYHNSVGGYSSLKVYSPNGKTITLTSSFYDGAFYVFTKRMTISGTSITNRDYGQVWFSNNGTANNTVEDKITVVKVLGYE